MKLKIAVIDMETGEVQAPIPMRAEQGWSVAELKQIIGEVSNNCVIFIIFFSASSVILTLLV